MRIDPDCSSVKGDSYSDFIEKCAERIVPRGSAEGNIESSLKKEVYARIGNELNRLKSYSEYKRELYANEDIEDTDIDSTIRQYISKFKFDDFRRYFFSSAIPSVTNNPTGEYSVIYYNPIIDIAFVCSYEKRSNDWYYGKGFFIFGEKIRGVEVESIIPAWIQTESPIKSLDEYVYQTVTGVGYHGYYDKLKDKAINVFSKEDLALFYNRVGEVMLSLVAVDDCAVKANVELNTQPKKFTDSIKNTNITYDGTNNESDYFIAIAAVSSEKSVVSYYVSKKSPNNILAVETIMKNDECVVPYAEYGNIIDMYTKKENEAIMGVE
jgi:hypothetical protein